jgi:hypothetical protein
MKTSSKVAIISSLVLLLALCGCGSPKQTTKNQAAVAQPSAVSKPSDALKLTIGELLAHKETHLGKKVEVTGYYVSWFEGSILKEDQNASGDASLWIDRFRLKPGHGESIKWVETGFVRVIGTFAYREGYRSGHMGACPAEITQVECFEPIR